MQNIDIESNYIDLVSVPVITKETTVADFERIINSKTFQIIMIAFRKLCVENKIVASEVLQKFPDFAKDFCIIDAE